MTAPIDSCVWTIIRITVGTIKDRLAAAGYQPTMANVERVMAVAGPQPAVDGLRGPRDAAISALISMAQGLEQRAQEVDDAE